MTPEKIIELARRAGCSERTARRWIGNVAQVNSNNRVRLTQALMSMDEPARHQERAVPRARAKAK